MRKISEEYLTGLEQIDAEHVVLLDLTDQARKLFENENMLFKCADIRKLLQSIMDCTQKHFVNEEGYMRSIGYVGTEEHCRQHRIFEQKLREFTDRVSELSLGTQDDLIRELFEYLQRWLHDHIKKEDMKYAEFAGSKAEGNH